MLTTRAKFDHALPSQSMTDAAAYVDAATVALPYASIPWDRKALGVSILAAEAAWVSAPFDCPGDITHPIRMG